MSSARQRKKIILKPLKKLGTIWHPESTLVYKSRKERVVIGRFEDEELIPLDDIALELCLEWKMKADESLLEAGSEEEEGEEEPSDESEPDKGEAPSQEESQSEDEEETPEEEAAAEEPPTSRPYPEPDPPEPEPIEKTMSPESRQMVIDSLEKCLSDFKAHDVAYEMEVTRLSNVVAQKTKELASMTAKYEQIAKKFEAVKSLFG